MTKKDKNPVKVQTITTEDGETVKVFEDLQGFETFIANETEDDDFDHLHCKLNYYPPFVLHESHEDPEKISDSANSHSKKFVRHLHQHIEKHLLKDIREAVKKPQLKFHEKSKEETFDKVTWHYGEETEYHERPFKIDVQVVCTHEDAMVFVDYKTHPVTAN